MSAIMMVMKLFQPGNEHIFLFLLAVLVSIGHYFWIKSLLSLKKKKPTLYVGKCDDENCTPVTNNIINMQE